VKVRRCLAAGGVASGDAVGYAGDRGPSDGAAELAPAAVIDKNPDWRQHLEATEHVPVASPDDLVWADGFAFGTPTRLAAGLLITAAAIAAFTVLDPAAGYLGILPTMALLGAGGTIVMVTGASQVDGLDAVRHGYAQAGAVGGGILVVAAIVVFALTWRRRSLPAEVGAAHDETSRGSSRERPSPDRTGLG
jgi:hypothetical protein